MKKEYMEKYKSLISGIEFKAEVKANKENADVKDVILHGPVFASKDHYWDDDEYVCDATLKKLLNECGEADINVHINSYGGDVFGGIACYNTLKAYKGKVNIIIDGIAASAGSLIALAGDSIFMPKTSYQMVHNAWTYAWGNKKQIQQTINRLEKIEKTMNEMYMEKFKDEEAKLIELLDNETFLTAQECLEYGLCTEIVEDSVDPEPDGDDEQASIIPLFGNIYMQKAKAKDKPEKDKPENSASFGWKNF